MKNGSSGTIKREKELKNKGKVRVLTPHKKYLGNE